MRHLKGVTVYKLEYETLVQAPLADTFAFFEDPRNLARITPDWMGFEILTSCPEMRRGLEIDYRFRWLGLPLRWKTLITEYDPPHSFVDEALTSPYKLWRHRHEFVAAAGGTLVRDRVDYALPFGPVGRAANAVLVSRQLRQIFRYRQAAIAEICGR